MGFRLKFNLILAIVCGAAFLLAQHYVRLFLLEQADAEVRGQAHASMAIAIREHTTHELKPFFDAHQGNVFAPQGIPAFAARETMRRFNANYPGHVYREVALNPTNLQDLAQGRERQLVKAYRDGSLQGPYEQLVDTPQGKRLDLVRPFTIRDRACLACHGNPADAPPAMVAKYGADHGFGWKLGETIGA